jgi:hypothetical protein
MTNYNDRIPDLDDQDLAHYRRHIRSHSEICVCIKCGKGYRHLHKDSQPRPRICPSCSK